MDTNNYNNQQVDNNKNDNDKHLLSKKKKLDIINNDSKKLQDNKDKNKDYVKMPHKSDYRMRAHCNPLSEMLMN